MSENRELTEAELGRADRLIDKMASMRVVGFELLQRLLASARAALDLRAEVGRLRAMCDERPEAFLKHLEARAGELAPDYPWTKHDAYEWLWALTSSLEGTRLANDDLHAANARLTARVKRCEEALRPFAERLSVVDASPLILPANYSVSVSAADCRHAAAVLKEDADVS